MTKMTGLANSCKECPHRHYYSGGVYECAIVQNSKLNADNTIPGWCPLPDYPATPVADSAMAKDAERYRKWVSYSGFTKEHTDATLDAISINAHAALAASEPKNTGN